MIRENSLVKGFVLVKKIVFYFFEFGWVFFIYVVIYIVELSIFGEKLVNKQGRKYCLERMVFRCFIEMIYYCSEGVFRGNVEQDWGQFQFGDFLNM